MIKTAKLDRGYWLWDIDLEHIRQKVSQLSWVQSAKIGVSVFPSKLTISINEHQPFVLAEISNRLWVVSTSGALISPIAEIKNVSTIKGLRSLPRLKGLSDLNLDETYLSSENARFHHTIKSLKFLLKDKTFPYRVGIVKMLKDGSLKLSSANKDRKLPDIIVNVRSDKDADSVIVNINKVLNDLASRMEIAQVLDMRFVGKAIVK